MAVVAVTRERRAGETRVATTPEAVKKLLALGVSVTVETGAGVNASTPDAEYVAAGATISPDLAAALANADILLKVRSPSDEEIAHLKPGAIVVGLLNPHVEREALEALAGRGVDAYAMEFVPRTSRAQAMDALSSQANLAGYRAVIEAAEHYGRAMPMMMTAAGAIAPAKVFVMGAGVAGLQAIATTWQPERHRPPPPPTSGPPPRNRWSRSALSSSRSRTRSSRRPRPPRAMPSR